MRPRSFSSPTGFSSAASAIFIVLLVLLPAAAQEKFTALHVARLRAVTSAQISPDGRHVAYLLSVPRKLPDQKDGTSWTELHVVDPQGNSRPFIAGEVDVSAIQWSPDGRYIAFLSKRSGDEHTSLYWIPLAGGEARKLVSHDTALSGYSFSPDGRRVAFLARPAMDKKKKELREKGFNQEIYEEDWQPVKVWIAGLPERPGDEPAKGKALDLKGSASDLHWAPEGSRLALALAPTPLVDDALMNRKLHVVDADSGQVVRNINNPGKLGDIAWSPDARRLAYVSGQDRHDPAEGRLMVVDVQGGAPRDLLPDYEAHVEAVAWKDNQTVFYVAAEGVQSRLAEVSIDGKNKKTHVPPSGPILRSLSVSDNATAMASVADSPQHPTEVFYIQVPGEPRRLTDSNPWLRDISLARQEVVRFQARDGLSLEGILVRPLDEKPGQKYPLILAVHGGPEAHVSHGWVTSYANPGQLGAAQGFAVFYPNYRGSTGRGVAFSKMGQADAAGKEFDDLIDSVDHLVEAGLVDRSKVGVTGGSYGGYASAWGATRYTDRFAASVMFVGISDNVSKVGTTDIPEEMYLVHHRKHLWDDFDYFLKRSPIYYVQQSKTPLLILHGKEDPRVHPSQSLELYRHMKTLGQAPVRLVLYPGEGHGNRRAASRLDYNLRLMRWMRHFLQESGKEAPPYELDYPLPETKESGEQEEAGQK